MKRGDWTLASKRLRRSHLLSFGKALQAPLRYFIEGLDSEGARLLHGNPFGHSVFLGQEWHNKRGELAV